ncbi:HNH endonuclease signature motif containing protein [Stenotrophomonas bentonitica]
MPISLKTQKMLWGRAANRCAICRLELVMDSTETDDESLVGEACHIVAASEEGPRGQSPLSSVQRDKFSNLILLCNVHHKQIDDQVGSFSVDTLRELKARHEEWVTGALSLDAHKQRDDELYAGIVEEWGLRVRLDNWCSWASDLLFGGQPAIRIEMLDQLEQIRPWILSRAWPHRYQRLENAFDNFRLVAQDLCLTFNRHAERWGDEYWQTGKFYKIDHWNAELYAELGREFEDHVSLISDLALELTRAANFISEMTRRELMPGYRLTEGLALVRSGPNMSLNYVTYRVEYDRDFEGRLPYPGLEAFMEARRGRDFHFAGTEH